MSQQPAKMKKRASFNEDRYRTATIDNPRKLGTPSRIDVGSRPVPNVNRGASRLSNADQDYVDANANYVRRSVNGRNSGYQSEDFTPRPGGTSKMVPCRKCGRSFVSNRIGTHERACAAAGSQRPTPSRSQGMPNSSSNRFQPEKTRLSQNGGSGGGVRQSRQPKFVFCYICGRQFTDASLPIHEPQCMQKWEVQNNQLPPSERRPRPKKPEVLTGGKAGGMNRQELQEAQWQAAQANLVSCRNCGRRFAQDRIGVHERICKGLKHGPAPAASTQFDERGDGETGGGVRNKTMTRSVPDNYGSEKTKTGGVRQSRQPKFVFCYICGRQFTDASLPIHEPQCMQKWEVQNNQLPPSERRPRPKKPEVLTGGKAGGMTREQLQEAQWQAAKANLVECRNCGRRFATDRIGVHERICKGLKHGPPPGVNSGTQRGNDFEEDAGPTNYGSQTRNAAGSRPAADRNSEPSGGGYKIPTKPRTVVCYLCGREFGSKSIGIHEPQCREKWHIENDKLPPHQRRQEPTKPKAMPISGRGGGYDLTAMNEAALQTAMDSRVPCANCGRKFNPDRVAIHERSCRPKVPYD